MLKWLKDELVQQLVGEIRRNAKRFDTIIEMLRAQSGVPAQINLIKEELSLIHGLVADLASGGDPEKLDQITQNIKTVRERLQASVDRQTKGE